MLLGIKLNLWGKKNYSRDIRIRIVVFGKRCLASSGIYYSNGKIVPPVYRRIL